MSVIVRWIGDVDGQGIWTAEIREILIPKTWFASYRSGEVNGCVKE